MSHDRPPPDTVPDGQIDGEATQVSAPPAARPRPSGPVVPPRAHASAPPASAHKVVPPTPQPARPAAAPSPFAPPPSDEAPSADPFGRGGPDPAAPAGIVQRAAPPKRAFGKGFTGTIMGTMVFIAQSKSVGTGAKIGGALLIVGAIAAGVVLYVQKQSRDESRAALEAALALPDEEGVEPVRQLVRDGLDDESLARALRYLGDHRDEASVPLFTDALEGTLAVQRAAADGLAEVGPPAAQPAAAALAGLLEAEDAELRLHAAWALARLEDARGLDLIVEGLATGTVPTLSSYDPRALAELMGRDGLLARLEHESATVRQFAARHLGDVCREADQEPLARAARDADASVSNSAIVSLVRCGMTDAARAQLAAIFADGHGRWDALYAQMRGDAGAPALGLLLPHAPDDAVRRTLTTEIAGSLDPRAASTLLAELERLEAPSSVDRLAVAQALSFTSHARLVEVLEPLLAGDDADHQRAAIALLGASAGAEGAADRLVTLLRDEPALRGEVLDALGTLRACDDAAVSAMQRFLSSSATRRAAMRALGVCGHERAVEMARREVAEPLATPVSAEAGAFRLAALEVVGARGVEEEAEALFAQASDESTDVRIRQAIADVLGVIAPDAVRDQALDRLTDPQRSRPVRAAMRRMLRSGIAGSSAPRLVGFVRAGGDDSRAQDAAILLGLAHHAPTRSELVELLGDERGGRHAALALALGAHGDAAVALAERVRRDDELAGALAEDLREAPWVFRRGDEARVVSHVDAAIALRDAGWSVAASRLCETLASPPEGLLALDQRDLARHFLDQLTAEGHPDATRELAAEALACMGARSAVLSVRDARSTGSDAARRALSFVRERGPEGGE